MRLTPDEYERLVACARALLARAGLGRWADPEDLVDAALCKTLAASDEDLDRWEVLVRRLHNEARQLRRGFSRTSVMERILESVEAEAPAISPLERMEVEEKYGMARKAIDRLEPQVKRVLVKLVILRGLSVAAAGERLTLARSTAHEWFCGAVVTLRRALS